MNTPNYSRRADVELAHIRKEVEGLPAGQRNRILNRCDKLAVLYKRQTRDEQRTPAQQAEQVAGEENTARRIVAALLAGRIVSQRDSKEFKTTAFHSRMADVRKIIARQYPQHILRSRYTEDRLTEAGRPFKLYWLENV